MSFKNLPILYRLIVSFAAVLVVSIVTSAALFIQDSQADRAFDRSQAFSNLLVRLNQAATSHLDQAHTMRGFLLTGVERHAKLYDQAVAQFAQDIARARSGIEGEREILADLDKVAAASAAWRKEIGDPVMQNARRKDSPAALEAAMALAKLPRASELQQDFRTALDQAQVKVTAQSTALAKEVDDSFGTIKAHQIVGGVAMIVAALLVGFWLYSALAVPIRGITDYMQRLAQGDNSIEVNYLDRGDEIGKVANAVQVFKDAAIEKERVEAEARQTQKALDEERRRQDERAAEQLQAHRFFMKNFGEALERLSNGDLAHRLSEAFAEHYEKLREDFNRSVEKLELTLHGINANSVGISASSEEISIAADEMARRTEQQAASLEETAAALDEITATVKKTAEGAEHARAVVTTAKDVAERSGGVVREAIQAMGRIERSSQQIGQIIGVIDEIAFQTNLLALNAGVEAARAGDAGRGFAVVATEVRALAQRSADAAKQIKELIAASSEQVEQGVDFVGKAGEALQRIANHVVEMNQVVNDIAVGAGEQSISLQQVNAAINEMDRWTQQSASMVEQSVSGTHALAQESTALVRLVAQFRLGERMDDTVTPLPASMRRAEARTPVARPAIVRRSDGGALRKPASEPDAHGWSEF